MMSAQSCYDHLRNNLESLSWQVQYNKCYQPALVVDLFNKVFANANDLRLAAGYDRRRLEGQLSEERAGRIEADRHAARATADLRALTEERVKTRCRISELERQVSNQAGTIRDAINQGGTVKTLGRQAEDRDRFAVMAGLGIGPEPGEIERLTRERDGARRAYEMTRKTRDELEKELAVIEANPAVRLLRNLKPGRHLIDILVS